MKKREFLKAVGWVGATLTVREGASALIKCRHESAKVVALNGSPDEHGNTAYALSVMGGVFERERIDFEIINMGGKDIRGCIACNSCHLDNKGKGCLYATPDEQKWINSMKTANAIILASPTCFGGIAGTLKSFLDRAFFSGSENFRYKAGAAVVTTLRSGASMTFESLNQYFTIAEMPVASSTYWNNIHGLTPDDLKQDAEGIRTLQNLAKNIIRMI
ncbi:MAG: flavodoxin family protein [Tannerella sp.]|jgi:multimeric flavodoxin WrbA|nr:flavodoxin family protein [Tannerella sp.]